MTTPKPWGPRAAGSGGWAVYAAVAETRVGGGGGGGMASESGGADTSVRVTYCEGWDARMSMADQPCRGRLKLASRGMGALLSSRSGACRAGLGTWCR